MAEQWYTNPDVGRRHTSSLMALCDALDERLFPPAPARLTHAQFCKFRQALLSDAINATCAGLATKIRDYMARPATKQLLQHQFNIYPTLEHITRDHRMIPENTRFDGLPGEAPDAVTGAILEDCAPCLSYLFGIGAIIAGDVSYNENGWALLTVAIRSRAFSTLGPLIAHSGLDPGPFQPSPVRRNGEQVMSILRLCATEATDKKYFHAIMTWCEEFFGPEEPRMSRELDASAQYNLCKMGCVRIANWLQEWEVNLGLVLRPKDGKCAWHAAAFKGHPAVFSWLSEHPAILARINHRDARGRTPLVYAVETDRDVSVSWLLYRLHSSQIRNEDVSPTSLKTPLTAALLRHSEKSVLNFQRIWQHDACKLDRHSAETTTRLCEMIITDLIDCRARLRASGISRRRQDAEWEILCEIAQRKCQILVKDSPADIYRGEAHKNCVLRARNNDLEFLMLSLVDERLMDLYDDEAREVILRVHFRQKK
ncbi:hypothetical protein N7492_004251 [Penicillium capsulatum]|uniref:Ankyrin n=1 Tax=Penicillium capsulatum TaxID=69766 RepID=A0A9W9I9P2_9EURO|nr:hypothetical protein N7492_004251 [Penicillium capsulatum]KAJ6136628.1 hypothetical protein N7512_001788 [Penicillium capsulatum]